MSVGLGIEASANGFEFAIVSGGGIDDWHLQLADGRVIPVRSSRALSLDWVAREIAEIVGIHGVTSAIVKRVEGATASNAIFEHAQIDGVVLATLARLGIAAGEIPHPTLRVRLGFQSNDDFRIRFLDRYKEFGLPKKRVRTLACAIASLSLS